MVGRQWTIICCTVMLHVKCEVLSFLCLGFSRKCRRVLLVFYLDGGIGLLNFLFFFFGFWVLYTCCGLFGERERGIFTFEDVEASVVHMKMSIITTFF